MKKTLSLLLALSMLLIGLIGCTSEKTQESTPPTGEAPVSTEPTPPQEETKSRVQEKLDAGEEVLIGYAVNTLSNPFLKLTVDYIVENFQSLGVTVSVMACEGDIALMLTQMENFIEMKVDMVICAPLDQSAVQDVCRKTMEAGIPVVFNGQYPAYYADLAGGAAVDYSELGAQVAKMSSKWIDDRYPDAGEGDIHAAVLSFNNTLIFKLVYEGMINTIAGDPRVKVIYTGLNHNNIDLGYTAAEEAMTMDRDIRLFMSFQEGPAIGINNYITTQPGYDLSEFAVFAGSYSDTSEDLIKASESNESIMRGSCNYGTYGQTGEVFMAEGLFQVCKGVLFETVETPFWVLDDIWTVDKIGYDLVIDNPENDFLIAG